MADFLIPDCGLRLSCEQILQLNHYIRKLMEITGSSGTGEELYALAALLTPVKRKGSAS